MWPTIEEGHKIDLRSLRRRGVFKPGVTHTSTQLQWTDCYGEPSLSVGLSFCSQTSDPWMNLRYTIHRYGEDAERIDETFRLIPFPQPFGGQIP